MPNSGLATARATTVYCPAWGTSRGETRSAVERRAHRGTEEKQGTHKWSTNSVAESQNARPRKTILWGSVCTEPLVLSLYLWGDGNSAPDIQKLIFSATPEQTFVRYSGESLLCTFSMRFEHITTSSRAAICLEQNVGTTFKNKHPALIFLNKRLQTNLLQVTGESASE